MKRKVDWSSVKDEAKERKKRRIEKTWGEDGVDIVTQMNKIWGSGFATLKKKQREEKCEKCLNAIKSKIKEIASRKSASRTLQLLIKHASSSQREQIASELVGESLNLAKDINGHHVILKLVMYGNKKVIKQICEEILKQVMTLAGNRFGCLVLDRVLVNPECTNYRKFILQQIYSKTYAAIPLEDKSNNALELPQILEENPEQRVFIMQNMAKFLENQLSKTPSLVLVQVILLQFLNHCSSDERKKLLELMVPIIGELFTSKEGQLAVVEALNQSTAKQRKKILQQLREHVVQMCKDESGVLILLRALDVTDDTVLTSKIILKPLLAEIPGLFEDKSTAVVARSRLCFLHVLCPRSQRYFKPKVLKHLPEPILMKDDSANYNSKKSNEAKQKELLAHVLPQLIKYCQENFERLLTKNEPLLLQTCVQCYGTLCPKADEGAKLLSSIVKHSLEKLETFDHNVAHRRLRGIAELCPAFCDLLLENISDDQILSVCSKRGVIVLVRCLQKSDNTALKEKLKDVINKNQKKLQKIGGKSLQILLDEVQGEKPAEIAKN